MEITTRFDYGDLSDSEQRHLERQAEKVFTVRSRVAQSAIEAGEILAEVQERLAVKGHGTFCLWVEERCGITPRHARNFIAAFERFGPHKGNISLMDDTAMFTLSAPSCPESAFKEALKLADQGKRVSAALAKKLIEKHKPADTSYTAHGLPGIGKPRKGSKKKRDPAKELEEIQQEQGGTQDKEEAEAPAESDAPGQPADVRGGVGTAPTAGVLEPSDDPAGEVIDASFTVVESSGQAVDESGSDLELALRNALLPMLRMAAKLSNELIKGPVAKCLNDAVDMLSTGEPIEERPSTPAVVEPEPLAHDVTGEESVMVFAISPAKKGGSSEWGLSQSYVDELQEVFAGVDVLAECGKARLWCANNPPKRKTAKGMREFLRRWMEKVQNSGGGSGRGPTQRPSRLSVVDEYLAEYGEGDAA